MLVNMQDNAHRLCMLNSLHATHMVTPKKGHTYRYSFKVRIRVVILQTLSRASTDNLWCMPYHAFQLKLND